MSKQNVVFGNEEPNLAFNWEDVASLKDLEANEKQDKKVRAKELLSELRSIVSNPCHDFKSKFNNINFTKTAKTTLDNYWKSHFKPIEIVSQYQSNWSIIDLDSGFRQAHIDHANSDKNKGFSPKIFIKKGNNVAAPSKVKQLNKASVMNESGSQSKVRLL